MKPAVTAAEMRALDRATIEEIGLPGAVLMETAGRALADAVGAPDGHVAVVCGPGNNGGDGFVAARTLRERGVDAVVYRVTTSASGDAKLHLDALERAGGVVLDLSTAEALEEHGAAIADADTVIDAVFGTGLARPVEGHARAVIERICAATGRVIAADLPSGLDADTGRTLGAVVRADITVTMGILKVGTVTSPGFVHAGEVRVADIGIPRALVQAQAIRAGVVEAEDLAVPQWSATDHKGRRGHVLVIAGSPGHRGAGRLAALAALRAGAGLVTLAGPGDVTAADPIMTAGIENIAALAKGKAAIVIGPGMAKDAALVTAALATGLPCVLDADALNQTSTEAISHAAGPVVITPHPGEAARLLGLDIPTLESDRLASVRRLASASRAVAVLKGARTVVCDGTIGDDFVAINPTGGPALATGGTGDVLAGAIGALIAQGLAPADAARTGVWIHGAAGDAAPRGAHAGDICDLLGAELARLDPIPRQAGNALRVR